MSEIFADEAAGPKSPQMQPQTYFEDGFGPITMAAKIAAIRSQNEFLVVA